MAEQITIVMHRHEPREEPATPARAGFGLESTPDPEVDSAQEGARWRHAKSSANLEFLAVALVAAGCARPSGLPPRFTGYSGNHAVDPASVREFAGRPQGYEVLGTVAARCRADQGVRSLDDELLSDVDCSESLLREALRDSAASAGGDALVAVKCRSRDVGSGDAAQSTLLTCRAEVGVVSGVGIAPSDFVVNSACLTRQAIEKPYDVPYDAWRVVVNFAPADPHAPARAARSPDSVFELGVSRASDVEMGDVFAQCRGACGRDAVRYAVRAGAARVGATDVWGIACGKRDSGGWACMGHAARPEVDPETNLAAR